MKFIPFNPAIHSEIVQRMTTPELLDISLAETPRMDKPMLMFLVAKDDGQIVGWVSAYNIDTVNSKCEVGIAFPGRSGLALVYPAARRFQRILFEELKLHRIYSHALIDNQNAMKLNEWLGMRIEGIEKEAHRSNGGFKDIAIFGMTIHDYQRKKVV